jgi:hypothetical protein
MKIFAKKELGRINIVDAFVDESQANIALSQSKPIQITPLMQWVTSKLDIAALIRILQQNL